MMQNDTELADNAQNAGPRFFKLIRRKWPEYLLEIIVISVGITLSLLLNEWRDLRRDLAAEQVALRGFHDNLAADSLAISRELGYLRQFDTYFTYVAGNLKNQTADIDSLEKGVLYYGTYSTLLNNDVSYTELQQTGRLQIIRNKPLLHDLVAYYTSHIPQAAEYAEIDKKLVLDRCLPMMMDRLAGLQFGNRHAPEAERRRLLKPLLSREEFRVTLLVNQQFKRILIGQYLQLQDKIRTLLSSVSAELRHGRS